MIIKVVVVVAVVIAVFIAVIVVAGMRAPVRHVARVSTTLAKPAADVWALVSDLGAWPTWNASIRKMVRAPDQNGHPVWALEWKGDVMPSEVLEATAPTPTSPGKLVTRIADPSLPFGGTWTWEIVDDGAGMTRVAITEDGFINNVVFRGMSSLFFGYTGTQHGYLGALAAKLGQTPAFEENVTFPAPLSPPPSTPSP